jgi:hypothetical protein
MKTESVYSSLHRAYLRGVRAGRAGLIENPYPMPLQRGTRSFTERMSWERGRMAGKRQANKVKTCKDIKREREQAWASLEAKYQSDIFEAREREFPIGTRVSFEHGHGIIEGVVTVHGVYDWNGDKVMVKNVKSGKEHEKGVWELTILPPESHDQRHPKWTANCAECAKRLAEQTSERLKRERV